MNYCEMSEEQLKLKKADLEERYAAFKAGHVETCVVTGRQTDDGRPALRVFEQHALSACFDVTLPGGGNVGSDGEHYVESAPGKFIRRIAERGIEVAVEAPLSGVVLPAVREYKNYQSF